jgi:Tfp pilus assembly protein PilO
MAPPIPGTVTVQEGGLLDRFPWYAQLGILLALVLVIWFLFDYFMFAGYRDEANQTMEKVNVLIQQNREADIIARNIEDYEKTLAELNAQFDSLRNRLPEQREVSAIFDNVKTLIEKNGLKLLQYSTGGDAPKQYYTEQSNGILCAGAYPQVQSLFQDLANYQRILNVTNISLEKANPDLQLSGATTRASFTVTAFYISEANRKALEADAEAAAKPAAPGGKPAAPPGQSAAPR